MRVPLTRNRVRLNYPDTYSYDLDGNQAGKVQTTSAGTETTTNTYNGDDQLTQSVDSTTGTTTYGYDANGSQTSSTNGGNVTTYTYDVRNRLVSVTTGGVTTTYGYDDAGNRVSETTAGTTTYYLIDSQNPTGYAKPIEQWVSTTGNRSTATLSMSYVIGDRVLAQVNSSGVVSYLLIDGQDNTRALTNSSGAVTATFNYSAFGDVLGATYTAANPPPTMYLFQQTMFDAPSGLNIFGDGVREVKLGEDSFIESDPPGYSSNQNPITLNSYLLDGANPVRYDDPSGHDLTEELVTETINSVVDGLETLKTIDNVRREVSSVFDILRTVVDIGSELANNDLVSIASRIENAIRRVFADSISKGANLASPLNIFESVVDNAPKIARYNITNFAKDIALTEAFEAEDAAIVFYLPGFLPKGQQAGEISTGISIDGKPLKIAFQGGKSLLGIGFEGDGEKVQLFHLDLVIPGVLPGHTSEGNNPNPSSDDIWDWYDQNNSLLNYQVPKADE